MFSMPIGIAQAFLEDRVEIFTHDAPQTVSAR